MRNGLISLVLLLAACSPASDYSEAQQAGFVREGVQATYAADPQPEWFSSYGDVSVENGWAYVSTTLTAADQDLAVAMCEDVAAVSLDASGQPMGVTQVRIYGADSENLADCDVAAG